METEFDFTESSERGDSFASYAKQTLVLQLGGRYDLTRHISGTVHKNNSTSVVNVKKLSDIFQKTDFPG